MHEDLLERISQLESEIRIMYFKTKDTLRQAHDLIKALEKDND